MTFYEFFILYMKITGGITWFSIGGGVFLYIHLKQQDLTSLDCFLGFIVAVLGPVGAMICILSYYLDYDPPNITNPSYGKVIIRCFDKQKPQTVEEKINREMADFHSRLR